MDFAAVLAALAALVLGGGWLLSARMAGRKLAAAEAEAGRLRAQEPVLREKIAGLEARLEAARSGLAERDAAQARAGDLAAENAALKAKLDAAEAHFAEQAAALTRLRGEVQDQFKLLAGEVLKASSEDLLQRADALFKAQKEQTAAEIDRRAADLVQLVKPLGDSLAAYDNAIKKIETERKEDVSAIRALLGDFKEQHAIGTKVTADLANALRAAPKTRGRWGEETLRRVMELSGMIENCDFETEKFFRGDENLRPDAVISVAGGRSIIVDAKAPVSAYLDAVSAADEGEREALLRRHAQQLRERLANLSSKSYWERVDGSADCVVMFVPGDNFVSAAFERDPGLFEDGVRSRVLICTPTTFIALTKAIAYGWRQDRLARSAAEVGRLGKDLYARLGSMGEHIVALGKGLGGAVEKYNAMVGSLEAKVMPQARRFAELGVEGTAKPLAELSPVDTVVRFPQGGRDLLVPGRET